MRAPCVHCVCPAPVAWARRDLSRFFHCYQYESQKTSRVTTSSLSSSIYFWSPWQFWKEGQAGILSPFHRWENGGSEKGHEAVLHSATIFGIYFTSYLYESIFSPDRFPEYQQSLRAKYQRNQALRLEGKRARFILGLTFCSLAFPLHRLCLVGRGAGGGCGVQQPALCLRFQTDPD